MYVHVYVHVYECVVDDDIVSRKCDDVPFIIITVLVKSEVFSFLQSDITCRRVMTINLPLGKIFTQG
jgi:hypothetical protein